jgi:hypothetical protein
VRDELFRSRVAALQQCTVVGEYAVNYLPQCGALLLVAWSLSQFLLENRSLGKTHHPWQRVPFALMDSFIASKKACLFYKGYPSL